MTEHETTLGCGLRVLAWGRTHTGVVREHNEDAMLMRADLGLFAVADGMGGHQGGDYASRIAVDTVMRCVSLALVDVAAQMDPSVTKNADTAAKKWACGCAAAGDQDESDEDEPDEDELDEDEPDEDELDEDGLAAGLPGQRALAVALCQAASQASQDIHDYAAEHPSLQGMGTTLTALLLNGDRIHVSHVGDSRCYLLRDGTLTQLTTDHSWVEEQVRAGVLTRAQAEASEFRHVVTRSVGFEPEVEVDVISLPVQPGDTFLLCSDGLSNYLTDIHLREYLRRGYYCEVPRRLVDTANSLGGEDNSTAVVVCVANDSSR